MNNRNALSQSKATCSTWLRSRLREVNYKSSDGVCSKIQTRSFLGYSLGEVRKYSITQLRARDGARDAVRHGPHSKTQIGRHGEPLAGIQRLLFLAMPIRGESLFTAPA